MIVIRAASSHQKSSPWRKPGVVPAEAREATVVAVARPATRGLLMAADEKRPSAVPEDDRSEHRGDQAGSGKLQRRKARPHADHVAVATTGPLKT